MPKGILLSMFSMWYVAEGQYLSFLVTVLAHLLVDFYIKNMKLNYIMDNMNNASNIRNYKKQIYDDDFYLSYWKFSFNSEQ